MPKKGPNKRTGPTGMHTRNMICESRIVPGGMYEYSRGSTNIYERPNPNHEPNHGSNQDLVSRSQNVVTNNNLDKSIHFYM